MELFYRVQFAVPVEIIGHSLSLTVCVLAGNPTIELVTVLERVDKNDIAAV